MVLHIFIVAIKANARHTCKTNVDTKAVHRNTKTSADKMMLVAIDSLRLNVYECDEYNETVFACVDAFVRDILYSISVEKAISYTKEAIRFQFHILRINFYFANVQTRLLIFTF